MKSRRHRAIYWAKTGQKKKSNILDRMETKYFHTPFFEDVIFLKPLTEESIFFEKEQLVIDEPAPKPNPIEDFKNAMSRLGKRLWRL